KWHNSNSPITFRRRWLPRPSRLSRRREMQDNGGRDAGRNGNDRAPAAVRKNTKGNDREAGQQSEFEKVQRHRSLVPGAPPSASSMLDVLAAQVRQQQQQCKRQR